MAHFESLPCQPVGTISEEALRWGILPGFLMSIPYGALCISILFLVPYTLTGKRYRRWPLVLAMILSIEAIVFSRTVTGKRWWEETATAASQVPARGQPLINAIERFKDTRGEYPQDLKDLQPDFIKEIPHTNMAGYSSFYYERATEDSPFKTYELSVYMGLPLQFDRFIYWPEGNYPEFIYGGWPEPFGEWVYIHE